MNTPVYTFKEICEKTGYKSSVIRYYEKEFELSIPRDTNSRRYFTQHELDKLLFIKQMQSKGYNNRQIKISMKTSSDEIACTTEDMPCDMVSENEIALSKNLLSFVEEKFQEISNNISELSQNVGSHERDLLISENMKLKMELKQKAYELVEIKEKLRYEKEAKSKRGLINRIFKRKTL